jgi:hypothetical protein
MSQVGHHVVFILAKWNAKQMITEHLQSNIVDKLVEKIPGNENMHWESKDAEFELAGKMYDVLKKEVINNKTIYYCINDEKESSLLEVYHNWIQSDKSNEAQKQHAKVLLKYISIECEMPLQDKQPIQTFSISTKMHTNAFTFTSRTLHKEVPPPKYFT